MPTPVDEALSALSSVVPFKVDRRLIARLLSQNPPLNANATDGGWDNTSLRHELYNRLAYELLARPFHTYAFHKIGVERDRANREAFFADLRRAHEAWVRRG
ncbi:hypothetical protein [Actinomadura rubrisoli]|uniref:Uncharacterized protein n=1 Tax=Actinomadura rubrisoli TaxID=2530368 RepID=A0A4R5A9L1_9ACTN|nr:hypothetical protein [Actinomadura rubrisoli]TDD67816.1 hypothetical protein E1298_38980 [Actinomadura rubrisoli]